MERMPYTPNAAALAQAVDPHLHTFIEPQLEQLHIEVEPLRCGALGVLDSEIGKGYVWATSVGKHCLVSQHHFVLNEPFGLEEDPDDYSCVCLASESTVEASEVFDVPLPKAQRNLCAFYEPGGITRCTLKAQVPYDSVSISFTPEFFWELERKLGQTLPFPAEEMPQLFRQSMMENGSPQFRCRLLGILNDMNPEQAKRPGAELLFHAKVLELVSLMMAQEAQEMPGTSGTKPGLESEAEGQVPFASASPLVQKACAYIAQHYMHHLTLEEVAQALFTSRSKLCHDFQVQTNCTLGVYLRQYRITQACLLLHNTNESIASIGAHVGYPRASSFTEAFLRETGMTPTEYRDCVGH